MSFLRDLVSGSSETPDAAWLRKTAGALTALTTDGSHLRRSHSFRRQPDVIRFIRDTVELTPSDLVTQLVDALCDALPGALVSKWEVELVRLPGGDLLRWDSDAVYRRHVVTSSERSELVLPEWFNADMRERVGRLIEAVGDVVHVQYVDIPRMQEERAQFASDLESSKRLTGEDAAGEAQLEELKRRVAEQWRSVGAMRETVLEAIDAFVSEVAGCRSLDEAREAASRLALFEGAADPPRILDSSAVAADTQVSSTRAMRLRSAARQIQERPRVQGR